MKSIRTQLFLIMIVLAIVPMLVVGVSGMAIADQSLRSLTHSMMDNHAQDILRRTEDRLSFLEQSFTEFSANLLTVDAVHDTAFDYDIQRSFNNHLYAFLLAKPEVARLLIVREDETVFGYNINTLARDAKPGETFRDDILTPGACAFLDDFWQSSVEFACMDVPVYRSTRTNEATGLILCHRIRDPETYRPIAVIMAHISFVDSPYLFDGISLWPEEELVLIRRDETVLASTSKQLVGTRRRRFSSGEIPAHRTLSADGGSYSYSAIGGRYGVEIQVQVPQRVLQETGRRQLMVLAAILVFTAALLTASFLVIRRRFFGKLGSLSQSLRAREQSPLLPIEGEWGDDEIGQLVDDYNMVTDQARQQFDQERQRLERLKELELSALQSQIKPHFLYNTLDVGVWYAKEGNAEKIQDLLIKLSRYYRLSLSSGASFIPIRDELHHALLYLEMEQLRMSQPFAIITEIPEEIMGFYIDKLTLQPIVENCIKHGIKTRHGQDRYIAIAGRLVDGHIELTVDDNGAGMDAATLERILTSADEGSHGYAVSNVHKRLTLRYGSEYGLRYQSEPGIGTSVRIILPVVNDERGGAQV